MTLKHNDTTVWYKGNFKAKGYFRTYYDRENWQALLKLLETDHEVSFSLSSTQMISEIRVKV